ncbi:MAG: pentapeptide repeat-containing protein, partial [Thermoguttaceae bacterium]|nr:pentapeptide repeat-containing protein [Thermoguttaceae bacterium]
IDFSRFPFSGVNMTGSTFFGCDFSGASFADSVVTAAQFSESAGLTVEQIKSTWNYKQGRMEGIILPEDVAQVLAAE